MTINEAQERVDKWIKTYGVRYFNELTNMAILSEEVGEVARIIARRYDLIATNRALLARGARDVAFQLGWPIEGEQMAIGSMRDEEPLTADERKVVAVLADNDHLTLDEVATLAGFSLAKAAAALFNLELSNRIHTLPGHSYQLSRR